MKTLHKLQQPPESNISEISDNYQLEKKIMLSQMQPNQYLSHALFEQKQSTLEPQVCHQHHIQQTVCLDLSFLNHFHELFCNILNKSKSNKVVAILDNIMEVCPLNMDCFAPSFFWDNLLPFINGRTNYQPPESGGERTIQGGSGSGKTQPNMDEKGGEIPGRKL